jgi:tripartite-type tricarboxylate transporter receptor subunit TctC
MSMRALLLCCLCAFAGTALAQAYPSKPVRMILGFAPGGSTDILFRVIAEDMGKRLGQTVVIENRPGAGGVLAAQAVKQAAPDGYAIWAGGPMPFSPVMMKENPMLLSRELAPISVVAYGDWFLYVPTSLNVRSLRELIAYAKANPNKFRFATISPFNTMVLAMVEKSTGIKAELIPYKTTDQSIAAVLTGDSEFTINAAGGFQSFVESGKLRAITTFSPQRTDAIKDVPTATEQGVPVVTRFSHQMWGPQGLPRDVTARLNAVLAESLRNAAVSEKLRGFGLAPSPSTPEELVRAYDTEIKQFSDAAESIGFKPQ